MTTLLKRKIDEQNQLWKRMQEIREAADKEARDWTSEERQNWDDAEKRLDQVSQDIERLERHEKLDKVDRSQIINADGGGADGGGDPDAEKRYSTAFEAYLRGGWTRLAPEQRELLEANFVTTKEARAQGTQPDSVGGYLVPEGFRSNLVETMKAFGGLLAVVEVITTSTGQDLPWPTNDDTSNEGEILGENTDATELDLGFGGAKLQAYIFSSKIVRVARALLQDSAVDLETFIPRKLGERIGRRAARAWTTGTGVDQPQGITVGITTGKTGASGQTTSIIYDDLVDLEHSVDPAYRLNARYVWHDTTLKVIRKLKDSDGRPLWVPVPTVGFPATVNGWPYTVDNSMPEMAASARSVVFGDVRAGYIVRQVLGVQTLRLEERYAERLQVGFLGFSRMDGMIQDTSAIKAYANAAS
jgi:HK97 family phage major capsid protein